MLDLMEIVGWLGAFLVLLAFSLNVANYTNSSSLLFLMLNMIGALLLVINSFSNGAYHFTLLNSVWFVVALTGLVRVAGRRRGG